MAQATDYLLANQDGASFRAELNSILAAIVSGNSGDTEPSTTYAFMVWIDTSGSGAVLKRRNKGDTAWITLGDVSQAYMGLAHLGTAQEFTKTQNFNATTLTFDATQDWDLESNQVTTLTLTGNTTFDAPTNQVDGAFYSITIKQDGTGGRTVAWNAVFDFPAGTAPTITSTASAVDELIFKSDGTNMRLVGLNQNMS